MAEPPDRGESARPSSPDLSPQTLVPAAESRGGVDSPWWRRPYVYGILAIVVAATVSSLIWAASGSGGVAAEDLAGSWRTLDGENYLFLSVGEGRGVLDVVDLRSAQEFCNEADPQPSRSVGTARIHGMSLSVAGDLACATPDGVSVRNSGLMWDLEYSAGDDRLVNSNYAPEVYERVDATLAEIDARFGF